MSFPKSLLPVLPLLFTITGCVGPGMLSCGPMTNVPFSECVDDVGIGYGPGGAYGSGIMDGMREARIRRLQTKIARLSGAGPCGTAGYGAVMGVSSGVYGGCQPQFQTMGASADCECNNESTMAYSDGSFEHHGYDPGMVPSHQMMPHQMHQHQHQMMPGAQGNAPLPPPVPMNEPVPTPAAPMGNYYPMQYQNGMVQQSYPQQGMMPTQMMPQQQMGHQPMMQQTGQPYFQQQAGMPQQTPMVFQPAPGSHPIAQPTMQVSGTQPAMPSMNSTSGGLVPPLYAPAAGTGN
jgi:hypothetical protein